MHNLKSNSSSRDLAMADNGQKLTTALSDAQSIIEAAERRAAELRVKTEGAYSEAYGKGYQQGIAEGKEHAVASAVRLLEDGGLIGDKLAHQAARLALAIAGNVIGEQVKVDPTLVRRIAVNALQQSIIGNSATIVVHPEDRAALENFATELRQVAGGIAVGVSTDPVISRGGCLVRTDFGEVDATISTLIEAIAARLGVSISRTEG